MLQQAEGAPRVVVGCLTHALCSVYVRDIVRILLINHRTFTDDKPAASILEFLALLCSPRWPGFHGQSVSGLRLLWFVLQLSGNT